MDNRGRSPRQASQDAALIEYGFAPMYDYNYLSRRPGLWGTTRYERRNQIARRMYKALGKVALKQAFNQWKKREQDVYDFIMSNKY